MAKKYERGPAKFLIVTRNQKGEAMVNWTLVQHVSNVHSSSCWEGIYNQVQFHLHHLGLLHGTQNEILYWGVPENVDYYIASAGVEIH